VVVRGPCATEVAGDNFPGGGDCMIKYQIHSKSYILIILNIQSIL